MHGGVKVSYEKQYAAVKFALPAPVKMADLEKIIMTASSVTGPLGIELYDAANNIIGFWWNKKVSETTDMDLTFNTTGYGGGETISADNMAKEAVLLSISCRRLLMRHPVNTVKTRRRQRSKEKEKI